MKIAFTIPGKARPRFGRIGKFVRVYSDNKTVMYESVIALSASIAMAGRPPIEGAVSARIDMRHPIPKSWSKVKKANALTGKVLPTVKVDADNCIKAIFDAINQIVWIDDVQVVDITLTKRYAEVPMVSVSIMPVVTE